LNDGHASQTGEPTTTAPEAIASRVAELASHLSHIPERVLDESTLSLASGIPRERIKSLLAGQPTVPTTVEERFVCRLRTLHATHRKPNGRNFSHEEIAGQSRMSRQQFSALLGGTRRPTAAHVAQLEQFFEVPVGFLTARDDEALCRTLQEIELNLLRELYQRIKAQPGSPPHARSPEEPQCLPLPDPAERRARREQLGLQLPEVAETLQVPVSMVLGWETGQEPTGELRARYARFLDAASGLAGLPRDGDE
jgi:transcriptional regulator with XRE-family HTH domain